MAKIELLGSTSIRLAVRGAKMCYGDVDAESLMSNDQIIDFLKRLIKVGHESILEHCVFTFEIHHVSRACLQEIARHRHISLSVKSTRWCLDKHNEFHVPDGMPDNIKEKYIDYVCNSIELAKAIKAEYGNDVAKYVLPEGVTTSMILTSNLRELRHMYALRTSPKALPEFQELMKDIVAVMPLIPAQLVLYRPDEE